MNQDQLTENYNNAIIMITNLEKFTKEFQNNTLYHITLEITTQRVIPTYEFFNKIVASAYETINACAVR
jgi:hypothetical protein